MCSVMVFLKPKKKKKKKKRKKKKKKKRDFSSRLFINKKIFFVINPCSFGPHWLQIDVMTKMIFLFFFLVCKIFHTGRDRHGS